MIEHNAGPPCYGMEHFTYEIIILFCIHNTVLYCLRLLTLLWYNITVCDIVMPVYFRCSVMVAVIYVVDWYIWRIKMPECVPNVIRILSEVSTMYLKLFRVLYGLSFNRGLCW